MSSSRHSAYSALLLSFSRCMFSSNNHLLPVAIFRGALHLSDPLRVYTLHRKRPAGPLCNQTTRSSPQVLQQAPTASTKQFSCCSGEQLTPFDEKLLETEFCCKKLKLLVVESFFFPKYFSICLSCKEYTSFKRNYHSFFPDA